METSALYFLGISLGHNTLTICAILANRVSKKYSTNPIDTIDELINKVLKNL
jgi:uridine phosphorylase